MTRTFVIAVMCALVASPALAQDQAPPAGAMPDMRKAGPMSRPVTKEDKQGVDALYQAMEDAWKKSDLDALAGLVDFPVLMLSDDSSGAVKYFAASREQWTVLMKPFLMNKPKDLKMSHKHTVSFLSDDLAVAIEDNTMSTGKMKGHWKSMAVLTLREGKWKFKQMAEAGWGDMTPATTIGAGGPRAPR